MTPVRQILIDVINHLEQTMALTLGPRRGIYFDVTDELGKK
jgi:hypothetical protein